ncbi:MAG: glycosyltransferase family 2 protein [bacterium]
MEVKLSGRRARPRDVARKLGIGLGLLLLALAPGLYVDGYFRVLATAGFVGLAILGVRTLAATILTGRRPVDPPAKPDGIEWPTVSVLIVAYNEAAVLPRTMAAMEHVRYPRDRIEFVYVYEKRSTDATAAIIRSFAERDARIVPVERNDKRGGKAAACNFGLDHCTGEILVSLDADHALKPDAIERAVRWFLSDPNIACVKGRPMAVNATESTLALCTTLERDVVERGETYFREVVGGFTFFGGGQAFFRRSLFEQIGRFDEEVLIEDIDFSVRIHQAGYRLVVDPFVISHEEHPANWSAWWAQRTRWTRGGMQLVERYLPHLSTMNRAPLGMRADLFYNLAFSLLPVVLLMTLPFVIMPFLGIHVRTFFPQAVETFGGIFFAAMPTVAWIGMWWHDRRDGVKHAAVEWLAVPLLWPYLVLQGAVFASAFLDEFVLRTKPVYVKTSKTGAEPALPAAPAVAPVRAESILEEAMPWK